MKLSTDYDFQRGIKELKKASKSFPNGSGIYKFIDSNDITLYVGKAKKFCKKRISSYLNDNRQTNRIKTRSA